MIEEEEEKESTAIGGRHERSYEPSEREIPSYDSASYTGDLGTDPGKVGSKIQGHY